MDDAVVLVRDKTGRLRVQQSYQLTSGESAAWGALWGGLVGAIFTLPFTGGLAAPAIATLMAAGGLTGTAAGAVTWGLDAKWWRDEFGISEDFLKDVGSTLSPGSSALFVLLRKADPQKTLEAIKPFGGKVLKTSLSPEQEKKLESTLAKARATKAA
jgi:uncharacterized membrane protein